MDDYDKKIRRAQRHEGVHQRLGAPNPVCVVCGNMDLPSLQDVAFTQLPAGLQRRLLEEHHLAGRKAGGSTVIVCRNCHARLSDDQYDWDPRLRQAHSRDERLAAFLQGLADLFRALGTALLSVAEALQAWVRQLLTGASGDAQR